MPTQALTLDEILAALAEYIGDDREKAPEVARALHKNPATQPIAQVLISRGTGKKSGEQQGKIAELETKITDLTEQRDELQAGLDELKAAAPDWKRRMDEQEERHRRKVTELQISLDTEKKGRREDKLAIHRQRFGQKLQPGVLVDPDYAEVLQTKHEDRFRLNDEGKLEVLEIGADTPYDAADGVDPIDLLVADVIRSCPPKWKLAGTPAPGGGVKGERVNDNRPKTFEQLKEAQKKSGLYSM